MVNKSQQFNDICESCGVSIDLFYVPEKDVPEEELPSPRTRYPFGKLEFLGINIKSKQTSEQAWFYVEPTRHTEIEDIFIDLLGNSTWHLEDFNDDWNFLPSEMKAASKVNHTKLKRVFADELLGEFLHLFFLHVKSCEHTREAIIDNFMFSLALFPETSYKTIKMLLLSENKELVKVASGHPAAKHLVAFG